MSKSKLSVKDLIDLIWNTLDCTEEITKEFIYEYLQNIAVFDERQRKYGVENIRRAGEYGVLTRANDKISRLFESFLGATLVKEGGNFILKRTKNENDITDESVEDSWRDLSVYACIALLVRSGKWK